MGKVRVLFTVPNLVGGGAERMAVSVAAALNPSQFESALFLHERRGQYFDEIPGHVRLLAPKHTTYSRAHLPRTLARMISAARACDVVVGANEGRATFLAFVAARLTRRPIIGWIHNDWRMFSKAVSWRQTLALKTTYRLMDAVVACSQGAGAAMHDLASVPERRLVLIPNMVRREIIDAQGQSPLPEWAEAIYRKPVVIAVGRLTHVKGFDVLIDAHAKVIERGFDHHLLIIGSGEIEGDLRQQAADRGVSRSVFLPGFQANPFALLKSATVMCLPSRFEAFPLAVLEALACRVPVIATNCVGPKEILAGGKFGRLVTPESVGELADSIVEMLADGAVRRRFAELGVSRASVYFPEKVAPRWEDLLKRLAKRGRGDEVRSDVTKAAETADRP